MAFGEKAEGQPDTFEGLPGVIYQCVPGSADGAPVVPPAVYVLEKGRIAALIGWDAYDLEHRAGVQDVDLLFAVRWHMEQQRDAGAATPAQEHALELIGDALAVLVADAEGG